MQNNDKEKILVTGAGGFIGHHLVRFLKKRGYWVRGVDIKYPEFSSKDEADEFLKLDLRKKENCLEATDHIEKIYALAANVGGVGFLSEARSEVLHDNVLINIYTAEAAKKNRVKKIFFASSACIYPVNKQGSTTDIKLKESDAYPANPENEYGWEKLFSERIYQNYAIDSHFKVRIGRYQNVYGPEELYKGKRAKAPGAIARKVALAEDGDEIEIWGDGKQVRSFCYIDDCVEGTYVLMESNINEPLNLGYENPISIGNLADIMIKASGKNLKKKYLLNKPQGVRGRDSDDTLRKKLLKWRPKTTPEEGLTKTYKWVHQQLSET